MSAQGFFFYPQHSGGLQKQDAFKSVSSLECILKAIQYNRQIFFFFFFCLGNSTPQRWAELLVNKAPSSSGVGGSRCYRTYVRIPFSSAPEEILFLQKTKFTIAFAIPLKKGISELFQPFVGGIEVDERGVSFKDGESGKKFGGK